MRVLTGCAVTEAIAEIVEINREITAIHCSPIPVSELVQDGNSTLSVETIEVIRAGLALRQKHRLPFWDSVLGSCFGRASRHLDLLVRALHHNATLAQQWRIRAEHCNAQDLSNFVSSMSEQNTIALLSCVLLRTGEMCHLPMLDFHCYYGVENEQLVMDALEALNPGPGYLVASGKSYHFIGARLLASQDLFKFLGQALLLSPIVDRAWIAHQLIEGKCALRISKKKDGNDLPYVIALHDSKK